MAKPNKPTIFTEREEKFLKELVKNGVQFIVVGLSAAALQGAPVVTQDIDLWFKDLGDPNLQKALHKVGASYIPPIMQNPPLFAGKGVQLFDIVLTLHGLDEFKHEIKNTTEIKIGKTTINVLNLDRILASKRAANRKKDKLVIPVLEDCLAALKIVKN